MGMGLDDTATASVARAQSAMTTVREAQHDLFLAVAQIDTDKTAIAAGYRSTKRFLQDILRINAAEAGRLIDRAHQLTERVTMTGDPLPPTLPHAAEASAAGTLGDGHLTVITDTMQRLDRVPGIDPDTLDDAEQMLVHYAGTLAPAGLAKVAHRIVEQLDPDGAAPDEASEPDDELHLLRRRDGSLAMKGHIHGVADAEAIVEVFDALATPAGPDDPRTQPQRFAEVLTELVAQAASPTGIATDTRQGDVADDNANETSDPDGASERDDRNETGDARKQGDGSERDAGCQKVTVNGRALLAVTIDHQWLQQQTGHGLLDSDHPVDPATARRLACDAAVIPVVLGTRSEPLDIGRLAYTVPEAIRRALHIRDGGCSFPGCTRRPKRCHAHHVRHWIDNGETKLENLTLLCVFHHHLIHHGDWTISMIDGRPWYRPPAWVDPQQTPRPGGRFPVPHTA